VAISHVQLQSSDVCSNIANNGNGRIMYERRSMNIFVIIWTAFGILVALIWLSRNLILGSTLRKREHLGATLALGGDGRAIEKNADALPASPLVSVLVAAKDEEANIEFCMRDLLAQDYPSFQVIVIDDRSRDATPTILQSLKKEFGNRLQV